MALDPAPAPHVATISLIRVRGTWSFGPIGPSGVGPIGPGGAPHPENQKKIKLVFLIRTSGYSGVPVHELGWVGG